MKSPGGKPSISIPRNLINVCESTTDTFTASYRLGGTNPYFQWKVNGTDYEPPTTSKTKAISTLNNNDVLSVIMTSNETGCMSSLSSDESNKLTMTINPKQNLITNISGLTPATIKISVPETGQVDEVRIKPVDSQMTTFVYDAFGNVLSQTNTNLRMAHFEYDG